MRILIDITHPAHAHFFLSILPKLKERGHTLYVTSRDKDVTLPLLDMAGITHQPLSTAGRTKWQLLSEMILRVWRLRRVIKAFQPHIILAREGVFACVAGWSSRVPAISFDDTDDAFIQQTLYFPFAWRIYTDRAYRKDIGRKQRFYKGVSCLAYLHPSIFHPDPAVLKKYGLDSGERLILVRIVSWTANHDYQHRGIGFGNLRRLSQQLADFGRVIISSEVTLPEDLAHHQLSLPSSDIHHLMAHCALYIGESPTMAAECAVLGVPAIHVSTRRLWYTDELEAEYQLVYNVETSEAGQAVATRILQDSTADKAHCLQCARYLETTDNLVTTVLSALDEVAVQTQTCNDEQHGQSLE